ncbi:MAG: proton-conducting transporter membrane subunit [Beijerinckiaceae bacterium]
MSFEILVFGLAAWVIAAGLALTGRAPKIARAILGFGGLAILASAITTLPAGSPRFSTPFGMGGSIFQLSPSALWLLGFGLPGAVLAIWIGTPTRHQASWIFGTAASLIGALGVFGLQDAASFLVAWEIMSLGGAFMILGEELAPEKGPPVLFMLALLEAGSVALILAFILLASQADSLSFSEFAAAARKMPEAEQFFVGLLLLIGFGAKLGLLPFYEWFPGAYGAASGATGALLSGVILNAAFFALSRGFIQWLPTNPELPVSLPGIFIVSIAVLSAILTALYAFQQEAWRELLSLSSAENGSIAVCLLGASLMFRQDGLMDLAGLASTVALLHLAGHALAKAAMFLSADGVYRAAGDYTIVQRGILARSSWVFGLGALFAAMSLAAMPPQAGFVSEWYLFQTFFQGFHLTNLASRLTAAVAGAGLALTAAIAFATFIKVFGIGLLGRAGRNVSAVPIADSVAIGILGLLVLVLAVGMPVWLTGLTEVVSADFGSDAAARMHDGWLLVPLTAKFAFISPSKLIIAMPLLALIPIALLLLSMRRKRRSAPVWYGGREQDPTRATTTALTFSNALRTFYSFIYRPTVETEREHAHDGNGQPYFTRRLVFTHDVAPIFGPYLFAPLERFVSAIAERLRIIQSGHLNFYLSLIGALLVGILLIALF